MRNGGGGARFPAEPFAQLGIRPGRYELKCGFAAGAPILRAVDDPAAPASELVEDFEGAQHRPGRKNLDLSSGEDRWFLEKLSGRLVRREQRVHFAEQFGVTRGRRRQPRMTLSGRLIERTLEQFLDLRPAFRSH